MMTPMAFAELLRPLLGLRFAPPNLEAHRMVLLRKPEDDLRAAVALAARSRRDFPAPVELLDDLATIARQKAAGMVEVDKSVPLPAPRTVTVTNPASDVSLTIPVTREWYHDCDVCDDSGLVEFWCGDEAERRRQPWVRLGACGHPRPHGAHSWVQPCACVATNPTIQRRKARQAASVGSGTRSVA